MEATSTGPNRTGAAVNPNGIESMLEAVQDLSPPMPVSTLDMDVERQRYITEADAIGSIPPPNSLLKSTVARVKGATGNTSMSILLDKLGERIAFERTGTRLYGALITKYLALTNAGEQQLPPADTFIGPNADGDGSVTLVQGETALDTLTRIRAEELGHFRMLCECMEKLGGDPTAQTPCADVTAAASAGLVQVVTDPRTTLAQSLNAILTAELTDNAGWELLSELAEGADQKPLVERFAGALAAEQEHLIIVRGWLRSLLSEASGTPAV
jgi:rubrerythrin